MSPDPDWTAMVGQLLDVAADSARHELARLHRSRSADKARRVQCQTVALAQIAQARLVLSEHPEAARAMYHGMQVKALSMVQSLIVDQRGRQRAATGGKARGQQKAREAAAHGPAIARAVKQWLQDDELQFEYGYRSPVPYVQYKTGLLPRTIQRAIKQLGLLKSRQ